MKLPSKLWGTNVGETIGNIIFAATGRIIIPSTNMMFFSAMWCFPNLFFELAPKWIAVSGIRDIHMKMHRIVGVFMVAIPTLIHIVGIFVPPLVDRTELTLNYSHSMYSDLPGKLNWAQIWDPVAVDFEHWTYNDALGVHITSDEVYRFSLMIVIFFIFFPLTQTNYLNKRSFSFAIVLHIFAAVVYALDLVRKIYHGLTHVFNLPLLFCWLVDRILSVVYYRKSTAEVVSKKVVGAHEYVELRLKLDKTYVHGFGDIYYFLEVCYQITAFLLMLCHNCTLYTQLYII